MFRYFLSPVAMVSILNMGYASPNLDEVHTKDSSNNEALNINTLPQSTNDNSKPSDQPKQQLDGIQPPENLKHTDSISAKAQNST